MKTKTSFIVSIAIICLYSCKKDQSALSQNIPDTGLYVSTQFTDASIRVSRNIVYATRGNYRNNQYTAISTKAVEMANNNLQLKLDIAVPPNASSINTQPLILFIHGGGFVTGEKEEMAAEALTYAKAGYVTASINYRLTQNQTNDTSRTLSRIHALEDAANAIRFLKTTRNIYFIDTNRIITIGSSAGGGLSLVNALETDASTSINDFPGFSSHVKGAIATGASLKLDDLTAFTISYNASDVPVLMFHAEPIDGGTGATWQDVLASQKRINASGNTCIVYPQPNMTHTVTLELEGIYWPQLKPFIWERLSLYEKK